MHSLCSACSTNFFSWFSREQLHRQHQVGQHGALHDQQLQRDHVGRGDPEQHLGEELHLRDSTATAATADHLLGQQQRLQQRRQQQPGHDQLCQPPRLSGRCLYGKRPILVTALWWKRLLCKKGLVGSNPGSCNIGPPKDWSGNRSELWHYWEHLGLIIITQKKNWHSDAWSWEMALTIYCSCAKIDSDVDVLQKTSRWWFMEKVYIFKILDPFSFLATWSNGSWISNGLFIEIFLWYETSSLGRQTGELLSFSLFHDWDCMAIIALIWATSLMFCLWL